MCSVLLTTHNSVCSDALFQQKHKAKMRASNKSYYKKIQTDEIIVFRETLYARANAEDGNMQERLVLEMHLLNDSKKAFSRMSKDDKTPAKLTVFLSQCCAQLPGGLSSLATQFLLDNGAVPGKEDLFKATSKCSYEMVVIFLSLPELNFSKKEFGEALVLAAGSNWIDGVFIFMSKRPSDEHIKQALMHAAGYHRWEIVEYFLSRPELFNDTEARVDARFWLHLTFSSDDKDLTLQALMVTKQTTTRDKLSLRTQDALSRLTGEQLKAVWNWS